MHRLIVALSLFLALSSSALAETVYFADRVGQAEVPASYQHFFEENGKTLVLVSSEIAGTEIRFTFNSLKDDASQVPTIGKDFVRQAASQRSKTPFDVAGNGAIAFIDSVQSVDFGTETGQLTGGIMGFDDAFVVFTIGISEQLADSPEARQLVGEGIEALLGGIRSR